MAFKSVYPTNLGITCLKNGKKFIIPPLMSTTLKDLVIKSHSSLNWQSFRSYL